MINALDILDKFNITLDKQYFYPRYSPREIIACCPFHNDGNPSFHLNIKGMYYYCFGCQQGGFIIDIIEACSNLSWKEAQKALYEILPPGYKSTKSEDFQEARYLSDLECQVLSWYLKGLNFYFSEPRYSELVQEYQDYLYSRGFSDNTIDYFCLGANVPNKENLSKPKKDYFHYYDLFIAAMRYMYPEDSLHQTLGNINLITEKNTDFWFIPSIIIPYGNNETKEFEFAEARKLPAYVTAEYPNRYVSMKGITRGVLFHENAVWSNKELFATEGAFNAIAMWQHGIKNVFAFGSASGLSNDDIACMGGKTVNIRFDKKEDGSYPKSFHTTVKRLKKFASEINVLELPGGEDPNSLILKDPDAFDNAVNSMKNVWKINDWLPQEVTKRENIPQTVTLDDVRHGCRVFLEDFVENFPYYIGSNSMNNVVVAGGKTTNNIWAANEILKMYAVWASIIVSQHSSGRYYLDNIETDSKVHVYGATHPKVGCPHREIAYRLIKHGLGLQFKKHYCDVCPLQDSCLHISSVKRAKFAKVAIYMTAHAVIPNFMLNPTFGNQRRQLVIVDDAGKLINNIQFTEKHIMDNIKILQSILSKLNNTQVSWAGKALATHTEEILGIFDGMRKAVDKKEDFQCSQKPIEPIILNNIANWTNVNTEEKLMPKFMLYELAYAMNKGLILSFDYNWLGQRTLRYTYRTQFSPASARLFCSATTSVKYEENLLGEKISHSFGEGMHVKYKNLHVIQLIGSMGSRTRLKKVCELEAELSENDLAYAQNLVGSFDDTLRTHKEKRVMILTSLGDDTKEMLITLLTDTTLKFGRKLVTISQADLENSITFQQHEIPVIHYGMIATNLFSQFQVIFEPNAYYYSRKQIIEDIKAEYEVTLDEEKFTIKTVPFKTLDEEYTTAAWVYDDNIPHHAEIYEEYIRNNQMADMIQAEARGLRDDDTERWVYRFHNVNVEPFATAVYRTWATMRREEFNSEASLKGMIKDVWEWIKKRDGYFTRAEISADVKGSIRRHEQILNTLKELEYIRRCEEEKWEKA